MRLRPHRARRRPACSSRSATPTTAATSRAPGARRSCASHGLEAGSPSAASRSTARRGTLRGLHYQAPPGGRGRRWSAAPAARCSTWRWTCVRTRATFRRSVAVELTAGERPRALHPPRLRPRVLHPAPGATEVEYLISDAYRPETRARPPLGRPAALGIPWPGPVRGDRRRATATTRTRAPAGSSELRGARDGHAPVDDGAAEALRRLARRARPGRRSGAELHAPTSGSSTPSAAPSPATGCAPRCACSRRIAPARAPRGAQRDGRVRLGGAARVERPLGAAHRARRARWSWTPAKLQPPPARTTASPFRGTVSLEELEPHLHSLPEQPDAHPLPDQLLPGGLGLLPEPPGRDARSRPASTQVDIDTTLADGVAHLRRGASSPARQADEVLVSTHCCHPSLANDNCAGHGDVRRPWRGCSPGLRPRYTYRFVFVPGHHRRHHLAGPERGADAGASPTGWCRPASATPASSPTSAAGAATPRSTGPRSTSSPHSGQPHQAARLHAPTATTSGSTARPGFDLAVGSLTRTPYGEYPEYHTSADDLTLVQPEALVDTLRRYLEVFEVLEGNRTYRQPLAAGASRSSASAGSTARWADRATPQAQADGDALGAEPLATGRTRCSTSPSARSCPSRRAPGRGRFAGTGLLVPA